MKIVLNSNPENRLKLNDIVFILFFGVCIAWENSTTYMILISALLVVALLLTQFYRSSVVNISFRTDFALMFFFIVYIFLIGLINGTAYFSLKKTMECMIIFSPIYFCAYYYEQSIEKIKKVLLAISFVWAYFMIKALLFYYANPAAARIIASDVDAYGQLAIGGGYRIAYGSCLLAILCLAIVLDFKKISRILKIYLIALFAISILLVIKTESTVTFIALLVGCLATIVFRGKRSNGRSWIVFIIALIVFFASIRFIGSALFYIADLFEGALNTRLSSLAAFVSGNDAGTGEYALFRAEIYKTSLTTFLKNPFFGVAYQHGNGLYRPLSYGVGNHCDWFDALANYGIVGGIPYLLLFYRNTKRITRQNQFSIGWIFSLIILCVFNPFYSFHGFLVLFFIFPLCSKAFSDLEGRQ